MKKILFTLICITVFCNIYSYSENLHEYITREAYKLLKLETSRAYISYDLNINNNNSEENCIVRGVKEEDTSDRIYHYDLEGFYPVDQYIINLFVNGYTFGLVKEEWFSSVSHFWKADNGFNNMTVLTGNKLNMSYSLTAHNAYQKVKRYENGYENGYERYYYNPNDPLHWSDPIQNLFGPPGGYPQPINRLFIFSPGSIYNMYNYGKTEVFNWITFDQDAPFMHVGLQEDHLGNTNYNLLDPQKKNLSNLILGRMIHLIQDMSVPAHVHNDDHSMDINANTSNCDSYEGNDDLDYGFLADLDNYYWTAENVLSQKGGLIDLSLESDPITYSMYTLNQLADFFASDDEDGNIDLPLGTNSIILNYYDQWSNLYPQNHLVRINGEKSVANCTIIRDELLPLAIRMTAGYLKKFAEQTNLSSYQYYRKISGNLNIPLVNNYSQFVVKVTNGSHIWSVNANINGDFEIMLENPNNGEYKIEVLNPIYYPIVNYFNIQNNQYNYTFSNLSTSLINSFGVLVNTDPSTPAFRNIQDAVNYVQTQCSPTVQKEFRIAIQNNTIWAPVYVSGITNATLTLICAGTQIETNRVESAGSGTGLTISENENCNIIIKNLTFSNNQLGVLVDDTNINTNVSFDNCYIKNNNSSYSSYYQLYAGAGIHSKIPLTVTNCTFDNNQASWSVASYNNYAHSGYGSALYVQALSGNVYFQNNTVKNNKGKSHAIYITGTDLNRSAILNVTGNTFKDNSVINGTGSNQYADDYTSFNASYVNTLNFEKNLIISEESSYGAMFSSLFSRVQNLKILNNTFADNNVRAFNIYYSNSGNTLKISNNVIWNNSSSAADNVVYSITNSGFATITSSHNFSFANKYNTNTNVTTVPAGFENVNPQLYLATESYPYQPKWTSSIISPCIDRGNPDLNGNGIEWYSDPDDRDIDGSRKDYGALPAEFHKENRITYQPVGSNNNINWISFPALNVTTANYDKFYNVFTNANLLNFRKLYSGNMGSSYHKVENLNNTISPTSYQILRPLGYQLTLNSALTVDISGFDLPENYQISLERDPNIGTFGTAIYNWVGYFLPQPMTAWQAFSGVLDKIDIIKAKNWTTVKTNGVWSDYGNSTFTISYGEMVMVHCTQATTTTLGGGSPQQVSAPRQTAQTFTYQEEEDYIPLFIDLNNETKSLPREIGLYINGVCQGASIVDNHIVQLNAYVLNDSIDYANAEISFVLHFDSKSAPQTIESYSLYDTIEKRYVNKSLNMSTNQYYYSVKLNDTPEVQYETKLQSNYPNPFNPSTTIKFSLKDDSQVELAIFNVKGQKIKTLKNEHLTKGVHTVEWNGKDSSGNSCASGVYFYRLNANNKIFSKKMLMIK